MPQYSLRSIVIFEQVNSLGGCGVQVGVLLYKAAWQFTGARQMH